MKKYLYLLTTIMLTVYMLNAQPPSQLLDPLSTFATPSKERTLRQADIIALKPGKMNKGRNDLLRSGAIEKMDSLVIPDQEKGTFHYDEHGHLSMFTFYSKLLPQDDWNPGFQWEFTFSPEGNLLEENYSGWKNGDWTPYRRDVYTYLANGNPNDQVTYLWDEITQTWVNRDRSVCAYLPDNKLDKKDYFKWDSGIQDWYINERAAYTYDAKDRLKEVIFSTFNLIDNVWNPQTRLAYFYNSDNQVDVFLESNWNGAWIPSSRTVYIYNSLGELILETDSWYDSSMSLIPSSQNEYEYDAYGNMITSTLLYWNWLSNAFTPEDRRVFEYDVNTLASDLFFPHIWDGIFIFNSKLTRIRVFEYESDTWLENYYGDFYYSEVATSIEPTDESAFHIYPNPTYDYIVVERPQHIKEGSISLISLTTGQPILTHPLHADRTSFQVVSQLQAGMYIVEIRDTKGAQLHHSLVVVHE